jgi:hypothetical protein
MYGIRGQILAISLLAGLGPAQICWAQSRLPERGLDKSTVETRLGAPQRVEGPVGEPPITKWIYADFIVVFEYDHVVHTVQRKPAVEQAPVGGAATPSGQPAIPLAAPPATPSAAANAPAESVAQPADPAPASATQTTGDTLSIP